jgi:hypothetical protein
VRSGKRPTAPLISGPGGTDGSKTKNETYEEE